MLSQALRAIDGLAQYPVVGLLLFVVMFVLVLVPVFLMDKNHIERMSRLPLDRDRGEDNG